MRNLTLLCAAACLAVAAVGLSGDDRVIDPEADKINGLVKQLGDDSFAARERATRGLIALGEKALSAVADAAATTDDLEVRRRASRIILTVMPLAGRSKGVGMTLVRVLPGRFTMGSPPAEPGRQADEPAHPVRITRPYYLGTYEVAQEEYERVMKLNPSHFSLKGAGSDRVKMVRTTRFPVESVTWFDAAEFCNRLSKLDGYPPYYQLSGVTKAGDAITAAKVKVLGGRGYRLPSEAEWEYACRADTLTPFHFGSSPRTQVLNVKPVLVASGYGSALAWPDLARTAEVGTYRPNNWGLYDMHGNVAEWCADWYDKDYYAVSPGANPTGPATGERRSVRGGSWLVTDGSARSAARLTQRPGEKSYTTGFRVARNP